MGSKNVPDRLVNYDILRIFAAYLIVMLHLSVQYINKAPASVEEYLQWQQAVKLSTISRAGVPLFIMLSGAFLLRPEKEINLRTTFTKYLPKLIAIFIFWSFFYSLAEQSFFDNLFSTGFSNSFELIDWSKFWPYFIQGHYHMWYLYMLAGLYLITPLIKHITRHATVMQLIFFTALCVTVTSVTKLNDELWNVPVLETILEKLSLSFFFGYIGYFIAGYLLSQYTPRRFIAVVLFALGIFSLTFTYENTWLLNPMFGFVTPNLVYFSNYSPTVFFMSFGLFLLFAEFKNLKLWKPVTTVITRMPMYMLVVYLVHPFIIVQCRQANMLLPAESARSLPVNALLVYVLSLAVSVILMEAYRLFLGVIKKQCTKIL